MTLIKFFFVLSGNFCCCFELKMEYLLPRNKQQTIYLQRTECKVLRILKNQRWSQKSHPKANFYANHQITRVKSISNQNFPQNFPHVHLGECLPEKCPNVQFNFYLLVNLAIETALFHHDKLCYLYDFLAVSSFTSPFLSTDLSLSEYYAFFYCRVNLAKHLVRESTYFSQIFSKSTVQIRLKFQD